MSADPAVALIGAGERGFRYARILTDLGLARVVALADTSASRRATVGDWLGLAQDRRYDDWRMLLSGETAVDAVIVATRDRDHYAPTMATIAAGHHVLVEKPMATTEQQCVDMVEASESAGVMLAVCHVLRYTNYSRQVRSLLDGGLLGRVVGVEHLEPVGWWHAAHSFVRGNWRREAEATNMLMAKSVHDIDWLGMVVDAPARRVSSFGSLTHFRPEGAPAGAAERCVDCPVEPTCPYSAPRLYLSALDDALRTGATEPWPLSVVTSARSRQGVLDALRTSPYGRCVYQCDNDVVDHQVVSIEYVDGATCSFTMMAFTPYAFRKTRIFGTHGWLTGDGATITTTDFRDGNTSEASVPAAPDGAAADGHAGGDEGLMRAFAASLRAGGPDGHLVSARESLESHRLTFAAERARLTGSVVEFDSERNVTQA